MEKSVTPKRILLAAAWMVLLFGFLVQQAVQATGALQDQRQSVIEDNLSEWFAGSVLHKYVGSNRDYNWYIDQVDTGIYSNNNCGPSSAVMVMKWLDEDFPHTAEQAREQYPAYGGWWNTTVISRYFDSYDVGYNFTFLDGKDEQVAINTLKEVIDQGKIALLCLDMNYISMASDSTLRINRFYNYADGHFLIVKGYAQIDEFLYFEVYDPNSWGRAYPDGYPLGQDRYYLGEELIAAAVNWYQFAIVPE